MQAWSDQITGRRFTPKEVALLTGVAEDRQRLIASRHFDWRESDRDAGGHRRWTWRGVQSLAAFHEIMADMPNSGRALEMVKNNAATRAYNVDHSTSAEDMLIIYRFDRRAGDGAWVDTASWLAKVAGAADVGARPSRVYIYNLSDLQRRLSARLKPD